jgi:hypothetical protein
MNERTRNVIENKETHGKLRAEAGMLLKTNNLALISGNLAENTGA